MGAHINYDDVDDDDDDEDDDGEGFAKLINLIAVAREGQSVNL